MEEQYRKLLQATLEAEAFLEDADNIYQIGNYSAWKDQDSTAPEHGSVTVFDFSSGESARIAELSSSRELRQYFSAAPSVSSSSTGSTLHSQMPTRRLFVLEGLDTRFTDILGSQLRVPPMVFIMQAASPGTIDITDADGFLHNPPQYWNVQVQQLHRLSDGFYNNLGLFWKEHAVPKRVADTFVKRTYSWSFTQHLVSFWSTMHGEDSWDALILVDPAWDATIVESLDSKARKSIIGDPDFSVRHDENSLPRAPSTGMDALPRDPSQWLTPSKPPLMSIRLRLIDLYTRYPHGATADPESASTFCKGIVFSMWELTIRCLEWRCIPLWDEEIARSYYHHNVQWRRADFQKLANQQLVSRRLKKDFFDVCRKLGVVDGGRGRKKSVGAVDHKERSWSWLLERITVLDEQIGDMIMVYGQRSSVEESLIANTQARSVGRLTALATVLVPFTVSAGIFSMSDEFAAGKSRFWVFWVVAVPLASVMLIWVFLVKRSSTQLLKGMISHFCRWASGMFRKVSTIRSDKHQEAGLPTWRDK